MKTDWKDPWLVAVWPGMGGIATIAGTYLVRALEAQLVSEVATGDYFDVRSVRISSGLIQPAERPASRIFGWTNPGAGRDLLLFVGDEQPEPRGYRFCEELCATALELGVRRVVTFAAMATPIRPEADPRVFAAASGPELLEEVKRHGVEVLEEGTISGLNGVLLAAAAARGIEGVCLLGEFPFFAGSVANPKASAAVLRVFAELSGVTLDLSALDAQAAEVERMLSEHLKRLEEGVKSAAHAEARGEGEAPADWPKPEGGLDPEVEAHIEALFEQAAADRSKALELKAVLDRHGVFGRYEDRFLDLFKQAG